MTTPEEIPPTGPVPQTPYGPPYAYAASRPTNGLAIGSLVTSIISLFVCAPVGIAGAIMGHKARRQIRERNEDGDGLAIAGIILGWVGFGLALVTALALIGIFVWGLNALPSDPGPAEPSFGGMLLALLT